MNTSYLPILIIIAGGLLYQISQKSITHSSNAYLAIIVAYLVGIATCLLCYFLYPVEGTLSETLKRSNWAIYGVGVGAVLIEIGFLVAYRQGWRISLTSMLVNLIISLILLPIGVLFYKEKVSGWNVLGVILYLAGLVLISRK